MKDRIIDRQKFIYFVLTIVFLPVLFVGTQNVGYATTINIDINSYYEWILHFYERIQVGEYTQAFNMRTMGYGNGIFLILSILSFPLKLISQGDQLVLITIRIIGLFSLLMSLSGIIKIAEMCKEERENCFYDRYSWLFVIAFLPASVLLTTHIHPEMFQLALFVWGTSFLIQTIKTNKFKDWIPTICFYGFMIGVKISGFLYLIFPLLIILFQTQKSFFNKCKQLLLFGVSTVCLGILILIPTILFEPIIAVREYYNEFIHFSKILSEMVISEFDYFQILSDKKEVFIKWLTHAFSHGYFSVMLVMGIVLTIVYETFAEWKRKENIKANTAFLIMFLANYFYYFLVINRVSSYYIYLPTIGLIICLFFNLRRYTIKIRMVLVIIVFIFSIPGFIHSCNIIKNQISAGAMNYKTSFYFNGLKEFLMTRKYPANRVYFPLSLVMQYSADEIGWHPNSLEIAEKKYYKFPNKPILSELKFYGNIKDIEENEFKDTMLVIDKLSELQYGRYFKSFLDRGWNVVYEDNAAIVLGNIPISISKDVSILLSKDKSYNWRKNNWQEVCEIFSPNINIEKAEKLKVSFEIDYGGEFETDIRIIINGYENVANQNIWHYVISPEKIIRGKNTFEIPFKKFIPQNGQLNWEYVSKIRLGSFFKDDVIIKNIKVEVIH